MLIQCLIERDGDTTVTRGTQNYVFRQNRQGHAVCEVQSDDHARLFLRMGPRYYRPYGTQSEAHARALKMIPKEPVLEEFEEDGELFEESVGIVEGRENETSTAPAVRAGEESLFPEMESAEEAAAALDAEPLEEKSAESPEEDPLVRDVATRLLSKGKKKPEVARELEKQFGLSPEEAIETVSGVAGR